MFRCGRLSPGPCACWVAVGLVVITGCSPQTASKQAASEPNAKAVGPSDVTAANAATPLNAIQAIEKLAAAKENPFPVPQGDLADVQAFLKNVSSADVGASTPEEQGQNIAWLMASRFVAANRIVNETNDANIKLDAQMTRLDGLRGLAMVGPSGSEELFRKECQALLVPEGPLATFARQQLLLIDVDLVGSKELTDATPIAEKVEDLLQHAPQLTQEVFSVVEQSAMILERAGHSGVVTRVLDSLRNRVAKEEEASGFAKRFTELELALPLMRLNDKSNRLLQANSVETAQQIEKDALEILLDPRFVKKETLGICAQAAQTMEFSGYIDAARKIYAQIGTTFGANPDARVAKSATTTANLAAIRLGLIGQTLTLEGAFLNGSPFDWNACSGKVVLVDFWATWCGPCLAEIPNIRNAYDRFHEQGLEVVGVNLDDDIITLDQFLKNKPLPWKTIVSRDSTMRGFENPNAVRCGIDAIPFLVLIGRDGKVAAIHVRGERLAPEIERLLKANPPATAAGG